MNNNIKKVSFFDYIIMFLFIFVIGLVIALTYYTNNYINLYIDIIQNHIESRLLTETRVVESLVTDEELKDYIKPETMNQEAYNNLKKELNSYADRIDLNSIYFFQLVNGQIQYIIDSNLGANEERVLDNALILTVYQKRQSVFSLIGEYQEGLEGILSSYTPVFDNYGNIIAVIGIDISDAEIVEREREAKRLGYISVFFTLVLGFTSFAVISSYRKKANESSQASVAKGQFLSKMSHEMRTPMNAIIGLCRMAQKASNMAEKDECINNISNSSNYLLGLINDILDVSKIEANKMTLNNETASIQLIMRDMEIMLVSQVRKKAQTFKIEIANDIPEYLYFDKTRLTQILINLIANALKFTPEKGEIEVRAALISRTEKACHLEFMVKDTGIGIDPEVLPNLFKPFEQADSSITRKFGGTGLGLAITKYFVEMMGGTISVQSTPTVGSTFKFDVWLELANAASIPESLETKAIPGVNLAGLSEIKEIPEAEQKLDCSGMIFLVAEDNNINQIIAKDVLEGFGATIEFAEDGAVAVQKFTENPERYKIIFMDIQMPIMDGVEATKKIRASAAANAKTIPIIAMTAEVFQEDINKVFAAGMNEHLGKPLDLKRMQSVIKEVLNK